MHLCRVRPDGLCSGRPNLARLWIARRSLVLWGRLEPFALYYTDACPLAAEERKTHPSEGNWALDAYHLGRVCHHIGLADSRAPHAAEAI